MSREGFPRFEIYPRRLRPIYNESGSGYTLGHWWYWRLRAGNGRITAVSGDPFASKAGARRSVNGLQWEMTRNFRLPIIEVKH